MEFLVNLIPLLVIMAIFYFLLIRPQKRQVEQKKEMLSNIKPGDSVVTIGGLHGVVDELSESAQTVVLDCEGIYLTFALHAIATVNQGGNIQARQAEVEAENEESLHAYTEEEKLLDSAEEE